MTQPSEPGRRVRSTEHGGRPLRTTRALLVDLPLYPLSAWLLRGLTGQSLGDRVAGVRHVRTKDRTLRPGVVRCVLGDLLGIVSILGGNWPDGARSVAGISTIPA